MGKPGEVASLRTPKGLFCHTHIFRVPQFSVHVCIGVELESPAPISLSLGVGVRVCVCMFTMGVVCEKPAQSETGIHPFPALVSECLGQ